MKIGNREFDVKNRTYIMGILNVHLCSEECSGKLERTNKMALRSAGKNQL